MNNLDDMNLFETRDPAGMGQLIADFPKQCRAAWQNVAGFELPARYREAKQLLILGMGGSAIGGDLLRTLVAERCRVPILVSREYDIPAWVNESTLVVASSHSGNTEETLSAFEQARGRGAMLAAITTGGKLDALAREAGAAVLNYSFESQPRAALGYSFISLLGVVSRLGWIDEPSRELEQALAGLETLQRAIGRDAPFAKNRAKQLAQELYEREPIFYGAGVFAEVAHRWKTQMNENANTTACHDAMSELNHNSVVGYEFPKSVLSRVTFVMLQSPRANARIAKRFAVTRELLDERGLKHLDVFAVGESALAEMYWLIHLGDYVTFYLALLNDVDPTPVAAIDHLKQALASA